MPRNQTYTNTFGSPMPARQEVIQQCSTINVTTTATNFAANETFSIGSVGGFVPGSVAGVTRFVSNPTGNALRLTSNWTTRPLATRAVAVAANTNYTLNLDLLGFSIVSGYLHRVRVNIIIPGGTTIGIDYTTTGTKSINFSSVNAGNVTIQIISIITGSGPYSPNPFVDIDNFSVTNIATTTTVTNVCDVFGGGYKYGFNGKEKDNEINVNGGDYDFGARIYDSRLGRWLSLDPLMAEYPSFSAYNFCFNNPIFFIDCDGKIPKPTVEFLNEFPKQWIQISDNSYVLKYTKNADIIIHRKKLKKATSIAQTTSATNIEFNTTFYSSYTSSILVLKTLVHELIHTSLISKHNQMLDKNGKLDPSKRNLYPGIISYIDKYGDEDDKKIAEHNSTRNWQHNWMADFGRGDIISSMKEQDNKEKVKRSGEIDGTSYTEDQFYDALSFSGLEGTNAWNNLSPANRTLYSKIITNELSNEDTMAVRVKASRKNKSKDTASSNSDTTKVGENK